MIIPTSQILAAIAAQTVEPGVRNALPRIENSSGKRASIYLLDAVSQWTPANAKDFQQALAGITAPHIDLFINSPGGSVFEGIAIYNFLKTHPAHITVHVVGLAASIASVIAMAGDEINMSEGSLLMIHSPSIGSGGNSDQLRKNATLLDQIEESIIDIYVGKTKRTRLELKALLRKESWFNADEAIAGKFAHRTTSAIKAAAEWKASDFPGLPVNAQAFASPLTPIPNTMNVNTPATAEAIAAEIIRQQAVKVPTGLSRAIAGFQQAAAEKSAAVAKAPSMPSVNSLTGLAKVTAIFKAQTASKS